MDYEEFSGKTIEDAITEACTKYTVTSDHLDYEIIDKGSQGFLGINSHPAIIKARPLSSVDESDAKPAKDDEDVSKKEESRIIDSGVTEKAERKAPEEKKSTVLSDDEKNEIIEKADKFLADVFKAMDIEVSQKISVEEDEGYVLSVNLEGKDMGVLIGKRGQTLDSLQYLVSLVINRSRADI